MVNSCDHFVADDNHPERFLVWVCSNLSCPEWGPACDVPTLCMLGHKPREKPLTLIARSDAEQMIREAR